MYRNFCVWFRFTRSLFLRLAFNAKSFYTPLNWWNVECCVVYLITLFHKKIDSFFYIYIHSKLLFGIPNQTRTKLNNNRWRLFNQNETVLFNSKELNYSNTFVIYSVDFILLIFLWTNLFTPIKSVEITCWSNKSQTKTIILWKR